MGYKPKPQHTIYKNNQAIGQAVTWHKAIEMLYMITQNPVFKVYIVSGYIAVEFEKDFNSYKIVKEN